MTEPKLKNFNEYYKTITMKKIFLILVSIIFLTSFTLHSIYIEPTGTYQLVDTTKNEDGLTYGYLGYIQVKKIA
ncbi:MAG TPA: hypothetical protein VNG53_03675, partial [Bacteroidia bacterium]|nr:hypothetical protein [Bacteroidia bacterium]